MHDPPRPGLHEELIDWKRRAVEAEGSLAFLVVCLRELAPFVDQVYEALMTVRGEVVPPGERL